MKVNLIFIYLCSVLIFPNCYRKDTNPNPLVQSGMIDLSQSNFEDGFIYDLNGEWQFYWMDFLKPGAEDQRKRNYLNVPSEWQNNGYPEFGHATYKLDINLPAKTTDLALDLRSVACSYEIYANGDLLGKQGKIGTNEGESIPLIRHSIYTIKESLLEDNRLTIILYVSNYHYFKGGLWDTISIGSAHQLSKDKNRKFILDLCILNCLMFMGFYHLGLYFTRRNDKSPLYFALFSFIVAIRTLSIDDRLLLDFAPLLNFSVINKIDYFTFFISGTFFLKFVESLFPDESNPKLSRWLHFFYLPPSLLVLFTSMYTYGRAVTYVEIGIFLSIIYIAHIIVKALKNHKVGAKLFLSGFIILTITAINDILKGKAVVYTPYTLGYGFTIFIIFQASILIRKYSFAFIKSEELARDLEDKVIKRTAELQTTLEQVKELKFQQDGDYFLTSQLLKPLSKNKADSTSISITFLTRQKKRFQFREWHEEIGGDLCMSNQIILGEKKYTVLVNADAMGKSLLGASGALVFGSVFESIINRNQNTKETQYETPDQWIKQTFLELHRVFETFDGSMLVSLVLVLIEEKSRSLFMINADHPPAVLYRDVKAVFLSPEQFLRKLGTLGANENISVLQYQLFPNDILILGSDGRDDLLIKSNDGTFLFNENDSLFLSQVEKCRGDLESIYNEMMKIGVLYDDLTLIKISVHS